MPFISFLFLITVAKTSNIMSNRSVKREPFCLISDFRAKAFSFSPLSMMLAVGLSYMAFIMLMNVPPVSTFWRVFINGC